jgi:hypothetical protein
MKECDNSTRKIHISSNWKLSISLLIMFDTLVLRPSLHCNTPLHFTTLQPTTLHYTSPHYTSQHFTKLHFTQLHFTQLHFTQLHFTTLNFTTIHQTTLHYTSPHYTTTLHQTTLHPTTLHYTLPNYTSLHFTKLHFTTLHPTTFHPTTLHPTTLYYTKLHKQSTKLHFTTPFFGWEIKPSVPCRSFTACKISLNVMWKMAFRQNYRTFLAHSSTFRLMAKVETSNQDRTISLKAAVCSCINNKRHCTCRPWPFHDSISSVECICNRRQPNAVYSPYSFVRLAHLEKNYKILWRHILNPEKVWFCWNWTRPKEDCQRTHSLSRTVRKFWLASSWTHCGRVTQICVFNTVKLGTSATSP